ncbi:hypothetical protein [Croceicoccus sp. Ery15]|uniref:hypothetical protein n=1 Tax=Croceicoccus sp. Ery15 TaxID=1703338 RepID=UPI001E471904|nr:hypothetical protein [Croceicoccus sp. Ery15]
MRLSRIASEPQIVSAARTGPEKAAGGVAVGQGWRFGLHRVASHGVPHRRMVYPGMVHRRVIMLRRIFRDGIRLGFRRHLVTGMIAMHVMRLRDGLRGQACNEQEKKALHRAPSSGRTVTT